MNEASAHHHLGYHYSDNDWIKYWNLYHRFSIYGYCFKGTVYQEGKIVFTIEKDPRSLRCPCCKGAQVKGVARYCAGSTRCQSAESKCMSLCMSLVFSAKVFDHFHLVKRFNDKLAQLRRDLHREAHAINRKYSKELVACY